MAEDMIETDCSYHWEIVWEETTWLYPEGKERIMLFDFSTPLPALKVRARELHGRLYKVKTTIEKQAL